MSVSAYTDTACYGVQYRLMFFTCNYLSATQGDDYLLILVLILILIEYSIYYYYHVLGEPRR